MKKVITALVATGVILFLIVFIKPVQPEKPAVLPSPSYTPYEEMSINLPTQILIKDLVTQDQVSIRLEGVQVNQGAFLMIMQHNLGGSSATMISQGYSWGNNLSRVTMTVKIVHSPRFVTLLFTKQGRFFITSSTGTRES